MMNHIKVPDVHLGQPERYLDILTNWFLNSFTFYPKQNKWLSFSKQVDLKGYENLFSSS